MPCLSSDLAYSCTYLGEAATVSNSSSNSAASAFATVCTKQSAGLCSSPSAFYSLSCWSKWLVCLAGVWSEQRTDDGQIYFWNKYLNTSKWTLSDEEKQRLVPNLDPYDNQLFIPLKDFMREPIAHEMLHNGEFLQVLGLTNYSHWEKAPDMRRCIFEQKSIADELLQFALQRIERFTHVGTTDQLYDSVESAAASLQMSLDDLGYGAGEVRDQGLGLTVVGLVSCKTETGSGSFSNSSST